MNAKWLKDMSVRIEMELAQALAEFDEAPFGAIQPVLLEPLREFLLRRGKRLRPRLFLIMNAAYSPLEISGIYNAAIALELLHNFILIHDDIVDRSGYRRQRPSLHTVLGQRFGSIKASSISPESLAMIIGDLIYAHAIGLFMRVEVADDRKVAALRYLTETALFTAAGELRELVNTYQPFEELTLESILQASQWKTAYYSFVCPMATGALLGGAPRADVRAIAEFGLLAGLAYQIRDDIQDIEEARPGNGPLQLNDIRDGKQTLPIWHTINNAPKSDRDRLLSIMRKDHASSAELLEARGIILDNGGVEFAATREREVLADARTKLGKLETAVADEDSIWSTISMIFDLPRLQRNKEA